jgi:hypothetical protein
MRGLAVGLIVVLLIAVACFAIRRRPDQGEPSIEPPASVELAQEKQESIWDAEHIAFEVEFRFGKPFVSALRDGDVGSLPEFFASDCTTSLLGEMDPNDREVSVLQESRRERDPDSAKSHDAVALVTSLVKSLQPLGSIDRIRLRALKVRPDPSRAKRWQTRLLLTARGTDQHGRIRSHESEHAVAFEFAEAAKIEHQRVVVDWSVQSETLRDAPRLLMEEVTDAYGLDQLEVRDNWKLPVKQNDLYHFQMAVEDFDRDGFLDIAIASGQRFPILLRSEQGQGFVEVASEMGLRRWESSSSLVVWIDYDNDGFPDLLMGDRLYHNEQGKRFEAVRHQGTPEIAFDPMGAAVADYDCDGLPDLYVLYQHDAGDSGAVPWVGDEKSGMLNHLWRNEGNGTFRNVTTDASASGGNRLSFAASWLFLDDDALPDLYVANDFGENVLLRNTGHGVFADVTRAVGAGDFATSMGVAAGDINNDGSPEIYVANMYSKMGRRILDHVCAEDYPSGIYEQILGSCAGNRLYTRAPGEAKYREASDEMGVNAVGWAYGPAFADFDNNGWLDLYATTGYLSFNRKKPDG